MRALFVCLPIVLIAAPASAAEFYIIQDTAKQSCTISPWSAKENGQVTVGDGAYNDQVSAAADMGKMSACKSPDATNGGSPTPTSLKNNKKRKK
jgi:hypothetical protein